MTPTKLPTGTVSFLFTDIEGSTRMWENDPTSMRAALARHDQLVRAAIERHGGVVFKTVGDAFCAAFVRALDALNAAVDAQRSLAEETWPGSIDRLRIRAGIHTGTATEAGGDYFGPTVNRVARLMSVGYGDQILVSGATAALLRGVLPEATSLRDLGSHRLKDLSEPEQTYQVLAPGLRSDFPALRSMESRPNNIPFQISSFIGRERELVEIRDALAERRLVSVVGAGGIGKTRLALQAAAEVIDRFPDGAWVVELAHLRSGELIPQAVADVLRIRETAQEPIEKTVARELADRGLLLVLDSAEHLLPSVAAFVKTVLSRAASVHIMVTTREPLHLTGEWVFRVGALQNAAELLLDRVREVVSGFVADRAALEAVEEICGRLECIPLAIELAAARTATMSLTELNGRLARSLSVLVSRDPTKEERHRTLRATIAWSDGLLNGEEARLFHVLGVFGGSFDLTAVGGIAGGDDDDNGDLLEALIEKSLVSTTAGSAPRYILYDTVREYLIDRMRSEDAEAALRARHFTYYSGLVRRVTEERSADVAAMLDALAPEISNIRPALEFGLAHEVNEAALLAIHLSRYWKIRGHIAEARSWNRRLLACEGLRAETRAALLRRAATFATEQDDYDEARALSEESRALYERLGDAGGVGEALHNLAVIEQRCGNMDEAAAHYAAAMERFAEVGHHYGESLVGINMTLVAFARGDLADAERWIERAARAAAQTQNPDVTSHISGVRGELALRRGDLDGAAAAFSAALEVKRALGNRFDVAELQNSLAVVSLRRGSIDEARAAARETLETGAELDAASLLIYGFEGFAEIALAEGRHRDAARLLGIARRLRHVHSYRHETVRDVARIESDVHAALGTDFEAELAAGGDADWRAAAAALTAS